MSTFADVLGHLEGGVAFDELNDNLTEVVNGVMLHRKVGEITLGLKIKPNGERAVSVEAAIKTKAPRAARGVTTFFADQGGNLLRRDPRQQELPLREAAPARPETLKTA